VLDRGVPRPRPALLATIAAAALAIAPASASAQFATAAAMTQFAPLGAMSQYQTAVGPTFAGSEVVWGERSVPGASAGTSRSELSIFAAVPGSHGSTLFSAPDVSSSEEETKPLGLLASPTEVAFAYQLEAPQCGPVSGACGIPDLPEVRSVAAFGGPPGGPFRPFGGPSLANGAIGLSGDEAVLAEPVHKDADDEKAYVEDLATRAPARDIGAVGSSGLSVAGSYIASLSANDIAVTTLAGTPVYSVLLPAGTYGCTSDSNGVGRAHEQEPAEACGFALDADGTLAIATGGLGGLNWASPAQPQLHPIAVDLASPLVAIADDEIVYVTPAGADGSQLALTDLGGNARPISFPLAGDGEAVAGLAFDGTSVAWADGCIYAGSVPASAPSGPPTPACEAVTVEPEFNESAKVARNGRVRIVVGCQYSPCSGTLTLTTALSRTTGTGSHKQRRWTTVTIASESFTGLAVAKADAVSLSLSRRGLKLLERSRHGLRATATATVPGGSMAQSTSAPLSLEAAGRR
jgi:hypothetical protein